METAADREKAPQGEIILELTGLAYGGEAFGRDSQGRMVFVPYALPGEKARVQITEARKRWARGRLLDIDDPSPDRIEPRCKHYRACGGCHYQHLAYAAQCQAKGEIVADQLRRIGGFDNPPLHPTQSSPRAWNYRNRLRMSLTPQTDLGFVNASGEEVIPIEECHLPLPGLFDLKSQLDLAPIPGLQQVSLRTGDGSDELIVLHGSHDAGLELHIDLPASVVWLGKDYFRILAGEGFIRIKVLERAFQVSAGSFFQVNPSITDILVKQVLAFVAPQPKEVIFDLYAGAGLFSAFLAEAGARVVAVEESDWAANDFEVNLDEFEGIELYHAPVEVALRAIPQKPACALVDPPRAGLSKQVIDKLVAMAVPRLVYVSCDPATFARDAKRLAHGGYSLEQIVPFDLFPQTFHIETVSLWTW